MNTQSTQRFVSDVARPRIASCRDAPQRNDLLVTSRLAASHRIASQLTSTQRFVCYQRLAAWLPASHCAATTRAATQLNDLFITTQRGLWHCCAPRRYSTQRFVFYYAPLRSVPLLFTTHLTSAQRNDLFFTTRRSALLRHAPRRFSTRRNATICFLQRTFPASRRPTSRRPASQLDDLFLTAHRNSALRSATQLNVIAN